MRMGALARHRLAHLPPLPRKEGLISQRSGANLKPGESGISRKLKLSTFTRSETLILTCIGEVEPLPVFSKSKIQLIYIRKALFFTRLFEIFSKCLKDSVTRFSLEAFKPVYTEG